MINDKFSEIRTFCEANASPEIVKKYERYFKEGFDGYGIEQKVFEKQRDEWITQWKDEMSLDKLLELGDLVFKQGRYEEKSFIIALLRAQREHYNKDTFNRIGNWFDYGIDNWATTDVLCMLVMSALLNDKVITIDELSTWNSAPSEWQRRVVPVSLVELCRNDLDAEIACTAVEALMPDQSEYVQKGIGTLLRTLWKKQPEPVEAFLLKWKDECGRLIVQYATEKMDKEYRKKFRKTKK
ncbi:DNA alkylation repair protein [Carboxylicivirga sp. RSCT41]|uniref:DNA alkylation repair protein n=1 Tax=Carboxylicivirga agarovorans TaxID=3417570 RepID=UPI003D34B987